MILIDATYIFSGGGKSLLKILIQKIVSLNLDFEILIDNRFHEFNLHESNLEEKLHIIENNELSRILFYYKNLKKYKTIFCFASIPPPFYIKNRKVVIYFHNLYLISNYRNIFSLKLFIKRTYFKILSHKKYIFYVQTNYIKKQLAIKKYIKNIYVLPFFDEFRSLNISGKEIFKSSKIKYVYIADSSQHKNHHFLLKTWFLFFDTLGENKNIELHLTLDYNNNSLNKIIKNYSLLKKYNIINHKVLKNIDSLNLLKSSDFLVYASNFESFGLPLIEACNLGCKIIAPDLEYVNQIIEPSLKFKPNDSVDLLNTLLYSFKNSKINLPVLKIENELITIINNLVNV
jgi:hypothetical protein